MQVLSADTKFAHLGKPGTAFSKGFARRLNLINQLIDLHGKKIVDVGCGKGVWLAQFAEIAGAENVYGTEYDSEFVAQLKATNAPWAANVIQSAAEKLPFAENSFDIVFSNEVLEHVQDDAKAASEAMRILKPGGKFIVFTPNRGWPFEQHGMFLNGKYYWGNIPLLPWMPKFIRQKFAPHVRNYSNSDIRKLFQGLPAKIVYHKHVFSGFDGLIRRFGFIGKIVQKLFHLLEKTPLHFFGISHFVVVEKL
jgi:ubiquinone/menaquinone biosynthesis C-methylase UbiE